MLTDMVFVDCSKTKKESIFVTQATKADGYQTSVVQNAGRCHYNKEERISLENRKY